VEIVPDTGDSVILPLGWDERAITDQMHLYSKQPALLSHYLFAIKERFIVGQNERTMRVRTEFLKTIFEQAGIVKNLQGISHDMARMNAQHQIEMMELDLKRVELMERRARQSSVTKLTQDDEELDIRLRMAQKRQQMEDLTRQAPQSQTKSKDRAERKAEIERDIERLKTEKVLAVGRAASEAERRRIENMYDHRIQQLHDDLERHL
jgi:hypothetical protein